MKYCVWMAWLLAVCGVYGGENAADKVSLKVIKSVTEVGLAQADATKDTVAEMTAKFKPAVAAYHSGLQKVRSVAVDKSDIDEVARIDKALNDGCVANFTLPQSQAVYKTFNHKLLEINKSFVGKLQTAVKQLLGEGATEDAAYVKKVVDGLNAYLPNNRNDKNASGKKTFKIDANKDWQKTGITLNKNTDIKITVNGTWAPGGGVGNLIRNIGRGRGRGRSVDLADADTYPLQVRVAEQQEEQGGKKWEFSSQVEGELEVRMAPPALNLLTLSEARGSVTVALRWEPGEPVNDEPLEKVFRRIIANEKSLGSKTDGSSGE